MRTLYDEIFNKAKKYLDTRHNEIHAKLSFGFAQRLLEYFPEADEDIVLTAIILHDVGWKTIPEKDHLKAFGPTKVDEGLRRKHELEGVQIAEQILDSIEFDKEKIQKVLEIIDGHDTDEKNAKSLNDQLVKDADKLWRFTSTGIIIDCERFNFTLDGRFEYLDDHIDEWLISSEAKVLAREILKKSEKELY